MSTEKIDEFCAFLEKLGLKDDCNNVLSKEEFKQHYEMVTKKFVEEKDEVADEVADEVVVEEIKPVKQEVKRTKAGRKSKAVDMTKENRCIAISSRGHQCAKLKLKGHAEFCIAHIKTAPKQTVFTTDNYMKDNLCK